MIFATRPARTTFMIAVVAVMPRPVEHPVLDGVAGAGTATVEMAGTPAAAEAVRTLAGMAGARLVAAIRMTAGAVPAAVASTASAASAVPAAVLRGCSVDEGGRCNSAEIRGGSEDETGDDNHDQAHEIGC